MKKEKYNVAVVGATGAVGEQMRELLEEREFPVGELRLLASERSAGQFLSFNGKQIRVDVLTEDSFNGIDIGLFSAGGSVSAKLLKDGNWCHLFAGSPRIHLIRLVS